MSDRSSLIRKAASLPKGSEERRSILRKLAGETHTARYDSGYAADILAKLGGALAGRPDIAKPIMAALKKEPRLLQAFERAYSEAESAMADWFMG